MVSGWAAAFGTMANYGGGGGSRGDLAQASVKGTVKWFNGTKGYGFITLENGGDAFCHASALQAAGHAELPQGATIVCDLQDSPRGLQVVAVHSVDLSTAEAGGGGGGGGGAPRGPRRDFGDSGGGGGRRFGGGGGDRFGGGGGDRFGGGGDRFGGGGGGRFGGGGGRDRDAGPSGPMVEGKVKFFNDQKGFGFVMPDSGTGDIYLHASALRRSGVQAVEPDQRIRYSTRQGSKGVEVDKVELI